MTKIVCPEFTPSRDWARRENSSGINTWLFEYLKDPRLPDHYWLWATALKNPEGASQPIENWADHVYWGTTDPTSKSQGFGGATITFDLRYGGQITLKGPWHSNAESLREITGHDITDRHYTRGVIALVRETGKRFMDYTYRDCYHLDEQWVLGQYYRVNKIAEQLAEELQQTLFVYIESTGGSHAYTAEPMERGA